MKGVSAILAAVLLIVVVVVLIGIFLTFSTSLIRDAQNTVGNRTAAAIDCSGASITVDEVFVNMGNNGSAQVRVVNNGLKDDVTLVSGTLFNTSGGNFSAQNIPITDFDVGEVAILRFQNIAVPACSNFAEVVVTTNCGTAQDTFARAPKCS